MATLESSTDEDNVVIEKLKKVKKSSKMIISVLLSISMGPSDDSSLLAEDQYLTLEVQIGRLDSKLQESEVHVALHDDLSLESSPFAKIAWSYVKWEKLMATEERISKLENELFESKAKVTCLENSLKELQQIYALLQDQNLWLEDELRTSVKVDDIKQALNCKYYDGIDLC
ncbi:hypothetical protein Nepgr_019675 [Nepenthes gracilis]|uniref:Uncharacterized protein n=1 Tax=Nepenthes gracilis TaxID=150966 RepID=A0AAD3XV99_NEPGR|nr:hypothetical protein Nepgr_019675 [Nepenthes gracilis]